MAKFVGGTAMYLGFVVAGGTVTLTAQYTTLNFNETTDVADIASGNDTWMSGIATLRSWTSSVDAFYDNASAAFGTADLNKMVPGTEGVFFFGPLGTVTGKPKYGGSVIVESIDSEFPFDGPVTLSVSFRGQGQPYWNHGSAF